jgi:endonuclease/exonuclease/phosphatase family metal-dependent hydrolase
MTASRICIEGKNCGSIAQANRVAFLVDGAAYFSALASTLESAQRFILIAGWQLDSRLRLNPEDPVSPCFGDFLHDLNYLAEATGMRAVAGPTIRSADIKFGNALLTSREITHVRLHDVTVVRRQPRGVIDAEIVCGGKIVRVLVTHFGLALNERRRQAQSLLKILRQQKASYALTLVIGDINEWRPRGFALYRLNSHLGKAPSPRTFPSFFPVFALDRIWVKPRAALLQIKTANNGVARTASNHLPVLASVNV